MRLLVRAVESVGGIALKETEHDEIVTLPSIVEGFCRVLSLDFLELNRCVCDRDTSIAVGARADCCRF